MQKTKMPDVPTSEEFTRTLGQVTWLMTVAESHRDKQASWIETHVCAPLMLKQVRVYVKGKQPLAVIIWAYASQEVKDRLMTQDKSMTLQDWRSGPNVTIVDCISPFLDPQAFVERFQETAHRSDGQIQ